MPKTSKKSKNSASDKMLTLFQHRTFSIVFFLAVFGLLGGAVYLYKSSANSLIANCYGSWTEIPGGGRALGSPSVLYSTSWGKAVVAVRGTNNGIYYTSIGGQNRTWQGYWQSAGGATYASPKVMTRYIGNNGYPLDMYARGTDNNTYKAFGLTSVGFNPWQYSSTGSNEYNGKTLNTSTGLPNFYNLSVRTTSANVIQYRCTK